jgi:vacuolar-type H+-ATPase subunit H
MDGFSAQAPRPGCTERVLAHLVEGHPSAYLEEAPRERLGDQDRATSLVDRHGAREPGAEGEGGGARRLVLRDAGLRDEGAGADRARRLVDPGPRVDVPLGLGRLEGGDGRRRLQLAVLEGWRPLGAGGDVGLAGFEAHAHLSRGKAQRGNRVAVSRQQPGGADRRMAGEGELHFWGVDPGPPSRRILDENGLAEAELGRDALPCLAADPRAVEEDAEPVAPLTVLVDEDSEDVKLGHAAILGCVGVVSRCRECEDRWVVDPVGEQRGVDVAMEDLKKARSRRAPALLAALAVGVTGVAWAGCGDGDGDGEAQQQIEQGLDEARQGIEDGREQAEEGLEKGREEAEDGLGQGGDEVREGLKKAEEEAEEKFEEGREEAEQGIEDAEQGIEDAERNASP